MRKHWFSRVPLCKMLFFGGLFGQKKFLLGGEGAGVRGVRPMRSGTRVFGKSIHGDFIFGHASEENGRG